MVEARVEREIAGRTFSFETGKLAKQASGAALVRFGGTVVLATAVGAPGREGLDFFPLTVDYREKTYAAGKFPGGFIKREGRPTTKEILTMRLIDRPVRPLFPDWYRDEVQVQCVVLSADRQNDPDILSMNGSSAALYLSPNIPFHGPIGAVRVGRIGGQLIPMPTHQELEESELDLIVAGNDDAVLMIEGFAAELSEENMVQAILFAHEQIRVLCDMQRELREKAGVPPAEEPPAAEPNPAMTVVRERFGAELRQAKQTADKQQRAEAVSTLRDRIVEELAPLDPPGDFTPEQVLEAFGSMEKDIVRELIVAGTRADGRGPADLREITCEVDVLPRTHGSAVFTRGQTQALVTVTLGTTHDEQRVDGLGDEYSKKFMLDYNFPPFSVGEVRPIRGPGRREIGHGALAERSVKPIVPDPDRFPYTVRVVSEILESNGSSSMASVCAATLGLMDAGVPISDPVAGISIGLVKQSDDRYVLLTDIMGEEDHFGDMDFKVAGTQRGVTGIQLDLKIAGVDEQVIRKTLEQAKEARMEILRAMLRTIKRPREKISEHAPRLIQVRINPELIGLLIGPGGKTIRKIQEDTGSNIEVEDDGTVTISSLDSKGAEEAQHMVAQLTEEIQVGKIYHGRVTSVKDFGAFVELKPGKDGLVHISELAEGYVQSVADVCSVGDPMSVKVIAIDEQDRVKLSRKLALRELDEHEDAQQNAQENE